MKFKPLPSVERITELLNYDPDTGVFRYVVTGEMAGFFVKGYRRINIDGQAYIASRLAFKLTRGRDPIEEIDHKNGNKADDSATNLREATRTENNRNTPCRKDNKVGMKGVYRDGNNGWRATIRYDGKQRHLGYFKTPEDAYACYVLAAAKVFGSFARVS